MSKDFFSAEDFDWPRDDSGINHADTANSKVKPILERNATLLQALEDARETFSRQVKTDTGDNCRCGSWVVANSIKRDASQAIERLQEIMGEK